jgi:hypothetical protein
LSVYGAGWIAEYAGIKPSSAFDQYSTSQTLTPGSLTPAGSGELFIASVTANVQATVPGGWTDMGVISADGDAAYLVNAGSGAENPTFGGGATIAVSVMAAFKPVPLAPLPPGTNFSLTQAVNRSSTF